MDMTTIVVLCDDAWLLQSQMATMEVLVVKWVRRVSCLYRLHLQNEVINYGLGLAVGDCSEVVVQRL